MQINALPCSQRGDGKPFFLLILTGIALVTVVPLLFWKDVAYGYTHTPADNTPDHTHTKHTPYAPYHTTNTEGGPRRRRSVGIPWGGVQDTVLRVKEGETLVWEGNLCQLWQCNDRGPQWAREELYVCVGTMKADGFTCASWAWCLANSGVKDWGYMRGDPRKERLSIVKRGAYGYGDTRFAVVLKDARKQDYGMYVVCIYASGPTNCAALNITGPKPQHPASSPHSLGSPALGGSRPPGPPEPVSEIQRYLKLPDSRAQVAYETGYTDRNVWLTWVEQVAVEHGMGNCIVCAAARPSLFTTPAPLHPDTDPEGFRCMLKIHQTLDDGTEVQNCGVLTQRFPVVPSDTVPPTFTPQKCNYTCLLRNQTSMNGARARLLGEVPGDWCARVINVTSWVAQPNSSRRFPVARADLWWYCGGVSLLNTLPENWTGICTIVQLTSPITVVGTRPNVHLRRGVSDPYDPSRNSQSTYINTIGVPRGALDQYNMADRVGAGFEAILLWITPNKNVDQINYAHYNVQRLANLTGDLGMALAEQMDPMSLMALQDLMALDMMLAENGGVCYMFGLSCCTYIPNNTVPDGSVTKALEGIRTLSEIIAEDSGVENPLTDWIQRTFGSWARYTTSLLMALLVAAAVLVTCGCCCVPCLRSLVERVLTTAIAKPSQDPTIQMPLLTYLDIGDSEDAESSHHRMA